MTAPGGVWFRFLVEKEKKKEEEEKEGRKNDGAPFAFTRFAAFPPAPPGSCARFSKVLGPRRNHRVGSIGTSNEWR